MTSVSSVADAVIDLTNTGENGASLFGPGFGSAVGNVCANVYAFSPDEQLVACCSCLITPNGLASLSITNDVISNTLTGGRPTTIVIKVLTTLAGSGGTGTSCANSAAVPGTLASGLDAWGTTLHATETAGEFALTERNFTAATLSAGEFASLAGRCTSIIGNASGAGVCNSCKIGGLGAQRQTQ